MIYVNLKENHAEIFFKEEGRKEIVSKHYIGVVEVFSGFSEVTVEAPVISVDEIVHDVRVDFITSFIFKKGIDSLFKSKAEIVLDFLFSRITNVDIRVYVPPIGYALRERGKRRKESSTDAVLFLGVTDSGTFSRLSSFQVLIVKVVIDH